MSCGSCDARLRIIQAPVSPGVDQVASSSLHQFPEIIKQDSHATTFNNSMIAIGKELSTAMISVRSRMARIVAHPLSAVVGMGG